MGPSHVYSVGYITINKPLDPAGRDNHYVQLLDVTSATLPVLGNFSIQAYILNPKSDVNACGTTLPTKEAVPLLEKEQDVVSGIT